MKMTARTLLFIFTLFSLNLALANDPVPYPNVGGGTGKVKVKEGTGSSSSTTDHSGVTKTMVTGKEKTSMPVSGPEVKAQGEKTLPPPR